MKKKDNHWFAHDKNSMQDPALMSLKAVYGMKGYGHWWALQEVLRCQEGYKYNLKDEFAYYHLSCLLLEITAEEAKQFVHDCIHRFKLLKEKNGYLYNEDMCEQMRALDRKRQAMQELGKKSAATRKKNALKDNELDNLSDATLQRTFNKESTVHNNIAQERTANNNTANNSTVQPAVTNALLSVDDVIVSNNNTIPLYTNTPHKLLPLEELQRRAIADTGFTQPVTAVKKITDAQLDAWLTAFNKWLRYRAETEKTETEYRTHFKNWFSFRNLQTENPELYSPATDTHTNKKRQNDALAGRPNPTIQDILNQNDEEAEYYKAMIAAQAARKKSA